jgi:radical SAM superfamily enzyme YgiQ (UPF0313 family)
MTTKKKIILFNPKPGKNPGYRGLPLPLLSISSLLWKKYDIKIVDALIDKNYCETVSGLIDNNTVCVGTTAMTGYPIKESLEISKIVKEKSTIPIIWGGWHPTILPEQTVSSDYVDIVVRGHGERTFYELVNCLSNNKPLNGVLGITYKNNGKIISNPDRPLDDINDFPPLPYELIDVEKSFNKELGERTMSYNSSYGCPAECRFCCEKLMAGRRWTALTPERVIKDFEMFYHKYKADGVRVADSNFFVDEERIVAICKGLIEKKIRLKWGHVNGRIDQLLKYKESTWKLMEESGCASMLIGAESGSQTILDFINKKQRVEDILKFVKLCKKYNIKVWCSLMFGFPGQNHDDEIEQTIKLIEDIYSIAEDTPFLWFLFTPYPGTDLYKTCVDDYGLKEPQSLEEWVDWELLTSKTPWIKEKHRKIFMQFPSYILPCMKNTPCFTVLKPLALFRLKHRFFSIPFEYNFIEFARKQDYMKAVYRKFAKRKMIKPQKHIVR